MAVVAMSKLCGVGFLCRPYAAEISSMAVETIDCHAADTCVFASMGHSGKNEARAWCRGS